ncbi:MAG TPA: DUF2075 domain-containing protein [Candidatus Pacearchaeota archaeon]|nr:hypothetical protein BMS3Abin17_00879 [archaeon BMS3Abin17]HDK42819.1 DUF2075 domain-containing protein [Candidatus Pacearchaeota archaeon]HDZ61362.1 DUF2075 domain-containing protein [Candidatus Pacearchaeota archaeon]
MKTIIIRGVPGTGKTLIANHIRKILPNSELICVDEFKLKAMEEKKDFQESLKIAYKESIKKLHLINKKHKNYIILEEIINYEYFFRKILKFVNDAKVPSYWFRLMRPLKKLLEVEAITDRPIKNDVNDFDNLKREIESIKIKNEHIIKNDDVMLTVKKILEIIR